MPACGPGGLEAARAAAIKGHEVTLYEKGSFLGGQFKSAAYPPCKGELATYTNWITSELDQLGVTIHLNSQVTKELVAAEKPDTVIVATGGTPCKPAIKGIDKALVVTAEDALLGNVATGDQIVVAGGGEVGSETAAHLAMQQRDVTIIEMLPKICSDLDGVNKFNLMKILCEYEVNQMTQTKVVEILDDGVIIENSQGQQTLPADTVVIALGYRPNNHLAEALSAVHGNVIVIGGAVKTSNAMVAINDGFNAGLSL
ncbi:FAD-dependent oxidoreductase [Acetobacterium wieringae]|uniref:FAD-dependent oxidoreductase n=1 Tax=Acetobacterium wieringae TaxID=52694 RepID=UPI0020338CE4|nr:FAD-dependent oxidoreductase [Acetobacterium wieringae]URN85648.1 NAD(P)/FAD-dependent oxidoreductase [Acetobacterium wieringae]